MPSMTLALSVRSNLYSSTFNPAALFLGGAAGIAYDFSSAANLLWRYNLLTWSEDFTNAAWTKTGSTVVGTIITESVAASTHGVSNSALFAAAPSPNTLTVRFKAGTGTRNIAIRGAGTSGSAYAIFDPVSGAYVTSGTSGSSWSVVGTPQDAVLGADGYYVATVSVSDTETVGTKAIIIGLASGSTLSYTGDGVSSIDVKSAMMQSGLISGPYQKITDPDMDAVFYCPQNPLYQDTTGSMAVTTPDETVGLALDTSRGLALGPELVTNGDFSAGTTGWTDILGSWAVTGGELVGTGIAANAYGPYSNGTAVVAGKFYVATFSVSVSSGSLAVRVGNDQSSAYSTSGIARRIFQAVTSGVTVFQLRAGGSGFTGSIDNISVREINSVPLLQANAGLRPKWGIAPASRRNLLTETEFRNGVTDAPTRGGLVAAVSGVNFSSFTTTGLSFGYDGVTDTYAYKTLNSVAVDYTISVFVLMDTVGAPNFGHVTPANVFNDFGIVLASGAPSPTSYIVEPLGGRAYRVSVSGIGVAGVKSFGVVKYATNSSRTFTVTGYQVELGTTKTPYQAVTNQFNITQAGLPSYGYIRPDLVDDVLSTTIPAAQTGDVLVFGRNGSWIESGVTYGAGSTWSVGATTVTGLPAGLLSAIGDIVGIIAIGRTLTATERQQALDYHKARGAAGWLVAGAEAEPNGAFASGTGWTVLAGWAISGGAANATATSASLTSTTTLTAGQLYLVTFDWTHTSGTLAVRAGVGAQATFTTSGAKRVILRTTSVSGVEFYGGAVTGALDNVSVKPLTVAA